MGRFLVALLAFASIDVAAQASGALGTLFQTPQERLAIDRARSGETGTAATSFGTLRPNPVITGYVKRSDGKNTVFIDNQPFEVKGSKAEAQLQPSNVRTYVAPPLESPAQTGSGPSGGSQPEAATGTPTGTANKPAVGDAKK